MKNKLVKVIAIATLSAASAAYAGGGTSTGEGSSSADALTDALRKSFCAMGSPVLTYEKCSKNDSPYKAAYTCVIQYRCE